MYYRSMVPGVIVMEYSTSLELEPHHQMQFRVIQDPLFSILLLYRGYSQDILSPAKGNSEELLLCIHLQI